MGELHGAKAHAPRRLADLCRLRCLARADRRESLPDAARPLLYEIFVFQQESESLMLQYMVPGVDGSTTPGHRRFNWLWYLKAAPGAVRPREQCHGGPGNPTSALRRAQDSPCSPLPCRRRTWPDPAY
ncbi:MAG: hypothetical protein ACREYA_31220 [Cupriavidus necator]